MRKERVPLIKPRRKFDSLGLSESLDVSGVGSVQLGREDCLYPVEIRVERAVLEPKDRERAGDDLGDRRPRSLLEHDLCGRAGDERQAAQLDEVRAVVFTLKRGLVRTLPKVLRENGGQAGEVTLKLQPQVSHEGGIHG